MRTLKQIKARQEGIQDELRRARADAENDMTEAQRADLDTWTTTLLDEYDDLEKEAQPLVERMERLGNVLNASNDDDKVEVTDAGKGSGPDVMFRNKRDPFEGLDRLQVMRPGEVRDRSLDAIERASRLGQLSHDYAEAATQKAQMSRAAQDLILQTGSDEYQANFREYLMNPENAHRAALSLTGANGGYLLPYVLDPTIVLTNSGSSNPWRQLSRVVQTASNAWNGVTSAGITAAWLAEGTETTDNTPTVGNIQITPQKASAWVFGSYEVLRDTDFANDLPMLLGDAKDRLEEQAFAVGTGSGQPKGVITGATTTVTAAGTGSYAIADIYSLAGSLPARFRNSRSQGIVMNVLNINRTRQFDTAGGASFWTNLGAGQPERVLGVPLYESTSMASTVTTGSKIAVYGDFNQYIIVDAVGTSIMYEPMVKGSNQRPTGQGGWFMYWRTGADVATAAAFRVLVAG